ncbi:tail length tape measure protein [Mycobacterium phage MyraDee]|uniref:Tape measure protein n=1 Tax=Mycobacterium phage MyraDee TaxID=2024303 RepID=A0A222YXX2_9CAUD|nr:tail length tape measure protein [Mycobacterium phage MyraDee]ASR77131.1 tape measure protein [Mycobacterium phage MyraDee]
MADAGGKEVGRISIRVVPLLKKFREEIMAELEAIERTVKGKVTVNADLDSAGLKSQFAAAMAELKAMAKDIKVTANVDANTAGVRQKVKAATKGIKAEVDVDVKRGALDRIRGVFDGMNKMKGPSFGSGINAAGYGVILGAITLVAAPLIGLITTALLTLPGLISLVLTPIAAIALGLEGLGKAAEGLKVPFDGLKKTMSDTFQERFTPIFDKLGGIFPMLENAMPRVAAGLADMTRGFVDTITSSEGMESIQRTINNIAGGLTRATPGIRDFTAGLMQVAEKFTEKMPDLADWFNGAGKSFKDWVAQMSEDGTLDAAFDTLGTTLKTVLEALGKMGEKGMEFMKDPAKMDEFLRTLEGIGEALASIVAISDLLNRLKPPEWLIGNKEQDEKNVVPGSNTGAFDKGYEKGSAAEWIKKTAPDAIKKAWNEDVAPFFSDWWKRVGDGWNGFWTGVGEEAGTAVDWTKGKWNGMTEWFSEMWGKAKEAPGALWSDIKTGATTAWTTVQTAWSNAGIWFSGLWETIKSTASSTWDTIKTNAINALSGIGEWFGNIPDQLSAAWGTLQDIAGIVWDAVKTAVETKFAEIVQTVKDKANEIVSEIGTWPGRFFSAITSIDLSGAGQALMDGLLAGIRAGAQKVFDFVSTIADTIARLKGPLPYDRQVLTPNGMALMQGLQDGIEGGFEGVKNRASQLADEISDAINSGTLNTDGLKEQLRKQMDELTLARDELKTQVNGTEDKDQKATLRDQMKQLQTVRDQLKLQSDQLGFSQKYGDEVEKTDKLMEDQLTKMVDIGKSFAMANVQQFQSDLGISGQGAIPQLAEQGLGWASGMLSKLISGGMGGTTIQVGSMDDALAAKQTLDNKRALQYTPRR